MTSTSPSSLAASCAPLLAASKTPMPSAFTTRAIFTFSALAGLAIRPMARARATTVLLIENILSSSVASSLFVPSACRQLGDERVPPDHWCPAPAGRHRDQTAHSSAIGGVCLVISQCGGLYGRSAAESIKLARRRLPKVFSLGCAQAELEQARRDFPHHLAHLVIGRMEGRRSPAASPLHGIGDHLGLLRVNDVPAVGVVVGRAGGGIESDRLLDAVLAPANLADGGGQR